MAKPRSTANLRQEVRYYYGLEEMSVVHTHPTSKYRYRGENAQAHVDPDQKEVLNQRQAEFIKIRLANHQPTILENADGLRRGSPSASF